jgi:hypothetical protein
MELEIIEKTIPCNSNQLIIDYYISFSISYNEFQNKIINTTRSVQPAIQNKMQIVFTRK